MDLSSEMVLSRSDFLIFDDFYQIYGIGPQRINTECIACSKVLFRYNLRKNSVKSFYYPIHKNFPPQN